MDPMDLRRLRERVRAGDHDAFTDLYRDHVGAVYGLAFRLTASHALAEEVTSETFLAAWRSRASVDDGDHSLLPWLLGISARQSLNATRGVRRRVAFLARRPDPPVVEDFADQAAARMDDARLIRRTQDALASLTRTEAEVLGLCVWSGLTYAEAAEALSVPIGTVRSRLARARARLRMLTDNDPPSHPTSRTTTPPARTPTMPRTRAQTPTVGGQR